MFVNVSSYCSEMPTTSNSHSLRCVSSETSGRPRAQLGLHIRPRRERALARDARVLVEQRVDDLRAQVAHPDVVHIRKREAHARLDAALLHDGLIFAAEIAHRLGDAIDEVRIDVAHDGA
jgi:hypothetical protein